MILQEVKEEEMYVLVSPDGHPQLFSIAPDMETCIGMCNLFAKAGICNPLAELFEGGFEVLPIKVSIIGNGTAEEGFQRAKQKL